jgi:hypothetical protein
MLIILVDIILLISVFIYFNNKKNKQKSEWLENYEYQSIKATPPWRKFEIEVANLFKERWFEVVLWPWSNDNWKDIVFRRWSEVYLVQCKHYYNRYVRAKHIRDFRWAIGVYEKQNNMNVKWIFITSWKTTSNAR